MSRSYRIALGIQFTAIALFAESGTHTYAGEIVNANCMQASKIVSRNSRGYTPAAGINTFVARQDQALNPAGMKKAITAHCQINPGTTVFALLEDNGNFLKLDETGNYQVLAKTDSSTRKIRATITGSVDRDILTVRTFAFAPITPR